MFHPLYTLIFFHCSSEGFSFGSTKAQIRYRLSVVPWEFFFWKRYPNCYISKKVKKTNLQNYHIFLLKQKSTCYLIWYPVHFFHFFHLINFLVQKVVIFAPHRPLLLGLWDSQGISGLSQVNLVVHPAVCLVLGRLWPGGWHFWYCKGFDVP